MPLKRRLAKPSLVLIAVVVFALVLSACAAFKEGSLKLSQPAGIGSVQIHFELCTEAEGGPPEAVTCAPNEDSGQFQYVLALSVPKGTGSPATITAAPVSGGAPIVYSRNDQVVQAFSEGAAQDGRQWPEAGHEGVGYLSAPFTEEEGETREWTVDADFGLPATADGSPFAGPFGVTIGTGVRIVSGSAPADRPVECYLFDGKEPEESETICQFNEEGGVVETGVSDLKVGAIPQVAAFVGGKTALSFPLDFASTATALPSFNLTATTTLPSAQLALANPTFAPGAPDPATHRSPRAFGTVNVTVPTNAQPGVYDVTLTAATPQGGAVSQVAKLLVSKPPLTKVKIKLGKVKLNKAKGTALLFVKVPTAGALTVSGKGIVKAKRNAKGAKTLKLPIKAKGKAKALLGKVGKAKVKAKITFKPTDAATVVKSKRITLTKS